jgi:hypothetical protein
VWSGVILKRLEEFRQSDTLKVFFVFVFVFVFDAVVIGCTYLSIEEEKNMFSSRKTYGCFEDF